jgi:hypothetical protein
VRQLNIYYIDLNISSENTGISQLSKALLPLFQKHLLAAASSVRSLAKANNAVSELMLGVIPVDWLSTSTVFCISWESTPNAPRISAMVDDNHHAERRTQISTDGCSPPEK